MEYKVKIIIGGVEVGDVQSSDLDAPYITNVQLTRATSQNPMEIGSSASDSLAFSMGNPFKTSFDGEMVELYISPQDDTSALSLSEIEELVGDETTDEVIDEDDLIGEEDDGEEGEDLTPEDEDDLEEGLEENILDTYEFFNGEDVQVEAEETDEEVEPEWEKIGTFYVYKQTNADKDGAIRFQCFDSFVRLTDTFIPTVRNTTIQNLYDDFKEQVMTIYGIAVDDFEYDTLYNRTVLWDMDVTYRQAIGIFAGLVGGYAVIGDDDTLGITFYTYNDTIVIDTDVSQYAETSAGEMFVESLSCDRSTTPYKEDVIETGEGQGVKFTNPFVTQEILDDILTMYRGIRYQGATATLIWDETMDAGQFIRIMTAEEYGNYVGLNNALEETTDSDERLTLMDNMNGLGKVLLISNATVNLGGNATAKVTSISGTEFAKSNPAQSPTDGTFKKLYAEMLKADYIDAEKIVTRGLESESAQIKELVAENLEVNSINGNVIKNSAVLSRALSNELVETITGSKVFYQAEEPQNPSEGDVWYKTLGAVDNPYADMVSEYQNGEWVSIPLEGNGIIRANSITAQEIASNTITSNEINTAQLFSQHLEAQDFDIKGGSVNISTDSGTRDLISLNAHMTYPSQEYNVQSRFRPFGFYTSYEDVRDNPLGEKHKQKASITPTLISVEDETVSPTASKSGAVLSDDLLYFNGNNYEIGLTSDKGQGLKAYKMSGEDSVELAKVDTDGNLYVKGKVVSRSETADLNGTMWGIGATGTKSRTSTISINTTFKSVLSIHCGVDMPAGTYHVIGQARTDASLTSASTISVNLSKSSTTTVQQVTNYGANGTICGVEVSDVFTVADGEYIYLNARCTSAQTLGTYTNMRFFKIR